MTLLIPRGGIPVAQQQQQHLAAEIKNEE